MLFSTQWNLDSIYTKDQFVLFLNELEKDVDDFFVQLESSFEWPKIIAYAQTIDLKMRQGSSYVLCLGAQNVHDEEAAAWQDRITSLEGRYKTALTRLEQKLAQLTDQEFNSLIQENESLESIRFFLEEKRKQAREKLDFAQESLLNLLAIDGFHGWSQMYDTCVGQMTLTCELNGEEKKLSMGQAANYLTDPDRGIREMMFVKWEETWKKQRELFSQILNHIAGFRLRVNQQRGWSSILKEPLQENRMSQATLNTMWNVIEARQTPFLDFIAEKTKRLGVDQLSWHDVYAPLSQEKTEISYEKGAQFILEQFGKFSPDMEECARRSFEDRWNEVEDRPGKRPGGFCTSFPLSRQSRIFMTYSGTHENLTTLAHELGHAYHQYVMDDLPGFAQHYPMNLAETASTFAEQIISDAFLNQAATDEERQAVLADRIQRSLVFFMNIKSRYMFELDFYKERKEGLVSAERLSELMEKAQRTAFGNTLKHYHPYFWASKLHFYLTDLPFYNFPYTFGYLFSLSLYSLGGERPATFASSYRALLADTGKMNVEDLARKHLGVDLTKPEFWEAGIKLIEKDIKEFIQG